MKLNKKNYFSPEADKEYVSQSQLKLFNDCEEKALAILNGEYVREQSVGMLVGSYVDAYLDGTKAFGEFKVEYPEIFTRTGELKADFRQAEEIITRIESDKVFRKLLRGRRQVIMTGTICGVPIKIKTDSLHKDKIVDGKVMKDLEDIWNDENGCYEPWWRFWHYDWQAYVYQTIVFQNTGVRLPFILAVATKEKGYDLRAFKFTQETIDNAGKEVRAILPRIADLKAGKAKPNKCGACDWCRAHRVVKKDTYEEI